jgi:uncharacterized damage-inducible protein DinB
MHGTTLKTQHGITSYVIQKNIEGLDHADSLVQPQPAGNCANWVLGHIVSARNSALGLVGKEPLAPPETFAAYGNSPIIEGAKASPWNELVEMLRRSQVRLEEGLESVSEETMSRPAPFSPTGNPDETVGSLLAAIAFHEAYHAGQLGLLRRLVGREGAVKGPQTTTA